MLANLGYFSLVLTFVAALYGAGAAAYGAVRRRPALVESARHAMLLTWPLGAGSRVPPLGYCGHHDHPGILHKPGDLLREPIPAPVADIGWKTSLGVVSAEWHDPPLPNRRAGGEPASTPPRHGHPPADALPRVRVFCDPLRFRHRRAGDTSNGRSLDPAHRPPAPPG